MVTSVSGNFVSNVAGTGQTSASDAAAATPVSSGVSGSAGYLAGLLAAASPTIDAGSSGLRSPVNPENSEALLLLVESRLDQASAGNRAGTLTARYGQAQGALQNTAAGFAQAGIEMTTAQNKLPTDQNSLTTAQNKQTTLEGQLATANQTVLDAETALADAPPDTDQTHLQALQKAVTDAQTAQQDISGQLDLANNDVTTATNAVQADNNDITAAQNAATRLTATLSQIATGLRVEVGRDTHTAADRSVRKETAYDDVAATAKSFRASELDRTTDERANHADLSAARDRGGDRDRAPGGDSGSRLAAGLADNLAAVLPILQGFAAAPPPAMSQTAALEAGGRVRLSL